MAVISTNDGTGMKTDINVRGSSESVEGDLFETY